MSDVEIIPHKTGHMTGGRRNNQLCIMYSHFMVVCFGYFYLTPCSHRGYCGQHISRAAAAAPVFCLHRRLSGTVSSCRSPAFKNTLRVTLTGVRVDTLLGFFSLQMMSGLMWSDNERDMLIQYFSLIKVRLLSDTTQNCQLQASSGFDLTIITVWKCC